MRLRERWTPPGSNLRHNIQRLRIPIGPSWLRLQKRADRDPHCETADAEPEDREKHHEKIECVFAYRFLSLRLSRLALRSRMVLASSCLLLSRSATS
jgi:hypothetical protein